MTRLRMAQLSHEELLYLADIMDVDYTDVSRVDRTELEALIAEALEESDAEQAASDSYPVQYQDRRFSTVADFFSRQETSGQQGFIFPEAYNVTRIEVLLRDPAWLFCYWDIAQADKTRCIREEFFVSFALRLEEVNLDKKDAELQVVDIPVQLTDKSWYINLENRSTRYRVHLLAVYNDHEEGLAVSLPVSVPYGGLSKQLEVVDSYELDALVVLSGIEHLGVAEMPAIPQRILSVKER